MPLLTARDGADVRRLRAAVRTGAQGVVPPHVGRSDVTLVYCVVDGSGPTWVSRPRPAPTP